TYARTMYWNAQDSTQALPDLLAQLQAWRQRGLQQSEVPALVDASAWNSMHLHVGSTFSIVENVSLTTSAHYLAVAEIEHIPTVDDNASGGVLVDFATMQAVQAHNFTYVPLNTLWLRTSSDPVALAHLRALLTTSRLRLDNLSDRRVILAGLASDPLALDLLGILSLGTSMALLLALVANILTPLLSVRARLTGFTILRALGAAPGQVVRILAWEQSLVFVLALLLGCLFGTLLSWSVVPNLVFTGVLASDTATSGVNQLFAIQQLLPTQIVVPASLAVALLVLVAICALALDLIGRVVLRPAMGQALRINED
ncbi:MAG: FtsX-like permease family protein, partial [Ktedonobacteraceae bacterium]